ncbi:hypothetical protein Cni_G25680 [Canna indica]|uniref:Uncharacterized protein n=1 Tax=Canna indica TaxID=4628 RepID=A0AAQ3L4S0_9LILI|nr:hypothetical protein Cni_G25680 [Canna indica]
MDQRNHAAMGGVRMQFDVRYRMVVAIWNRNSNSSKDCNTRPLANHIIKWM